MYYMIYAKDKQDGKQIRDRIRGAHRRFVRTPSNGGVTIHIAGPLYAEDGTSMVASLWLVEADDIETVRRFAESIPYKKANLYESIDIRPFGWSLHPPAKKQ